jgi:hypothetical protein
LIAALRVQRGDHRGQGRSVLAAYTEDVNGHFAVYVDQVLRTSLRTPACRKKNAVAPVAPCFICSSNEPAQS